MYMNYCGKINKFPFQSCLFINVSKQEVDLLIKIVYQKQLWPRGEPIGFVRHMI